MLIFSGEEQGFGSDVEVAPVQFIESVDEASGLLTHNYPLLDSTIQKVSVARHSVRVFCCFENERIVLIFNNAV